MGEQGGGGVESTYLSEATAGSGTEAGAGRYRRDCAVTDCGWGRHAPGATRRAPRCTRTWTWIGTRSGDALAGRRRRRRRADAADCPPDSRPAGQLSWRVRLGGLPATRRPAKCGLTERMNVPIGLSACACGLERSSAAVQLTASRRAVRGSESRSPLFSRCYLSLSRSPAHKPALIQTRRRSFGAPMPRRRAPPLTAFKSHTNLARMIFEKGNIMSHTPGRVLPRPGPPPCGSGPRAQGVVWSGWWQHGASIRSPGRRAAPGGRAKRCPGPAWRRPP